MADYYTQTAFAVSISRADAALIMEIDGLLETLGDGFQSAAEADAAYAATSAEFQAVFPKGEGGDPFFELTSLFDDPIWPKLGCSLQVRADPDRPDLAQLFVSGDDAQPYSIAALFRRACPSALPFRFGWAYTCSRQIVDGFGGGYMEVRADRDVRLIDPDDAVVEPQLVLGAGDANNGILFWSSTTGFASSTPASVLTTAQARETLVPVEGSDLNWYELHRVDLADAQGTG